MMCPECALISTVKAARMQPASTHDPLSTAHAMCDRTKTHHTGRSDSQEASSRPTRRARSLGAITSARAWSLKLKLVGVGAAGHRVSCCDKQTNSACARGCSLKLRLIGGGAAGQKV